MERMHAMRTVHTLAALVAVVSILSALAIGPSTASAHSDRVYHGNDYATVAENHMSGTVCDRERDGHWVYAVWYLTDDSYVSEFDGGDAGCDSTGRFPLPAYEFLICEEDKGCRSEFT
jgi:hypothetical protein